METTTTTTQQQPLFLHPPSTTNHQPPHSLHYTIEVLIVYSKSHVYSEFKNYAEVLVNKGPLSMQTINNSKIDQLN